MVCLSADVETLLRRAGNRKQRPLLMATDKAQRINELLGQRQKYYATAHIEIDTSNLTVEEAVEKIIALAGPANQFISCRR